MKQSEGCGPYSRCTKRVNCDPWRHRSRGDTSLRDESQVQLMLFAAQVLRQQGSYTFGATAAEMRDQQENPVLLRHSKFSTEK
jgi:Tfp pilus assembly protein PilN